MKHIERIIEEIDQVLADNDEWRRRNVEQEPKSKPHR